MPNTTNNDIKNAGSTSAANLIWSNETFNDYFKQRQEIERNIAQLQLDLSKRNSQTIKNLKEEAELEAAKEEYTRRIAFQKKLIEFERQGIKLSQKEKDALQKKSEKDKQKEEKARLKEVKKELSQAMGSDLHDQVKDAFKNGLSVDSLKSFGGSMKSLMKGIGGDLGESLKDAAKEAIKNLGEAGAQSINDAMGLLSGVYSGIEARLQSSGKSFKAINDSMRVQLAVSPFVKYTDMLDKIDTLVESGVAYNVEQRAFLASVSDKIATTFDAFDSNLLQIIRIQQEDSTQQRLGMEAQLTKFLNSRYRDTSYLSGTHDSVTEALTASIVQLGTAKGAEYEYNVQKWFGSLSALGLSDNTLTGLAGALNSLATGDIDALSNSEYMNLIVMAANRAGIPYADILTKGLNENNVNDLIAEIVAYWANIATETNQVVKNQYSKLFGLNMTDMTAIKNLTENEINEIRGTQLSYSGMRDELTSQLSQVKNRMHISEMIDNVTDNFMTGLGLNIASNPFMATTWIINDMVKKATGGINIPTLSAFVAGSGTILDPNTDLNSLIQLTMVGGSTIAQIGKVLENLSNIGGLNLNAWGGDQYNTRGGGFTSPVTGVTASTSQTTYIGNSSFNDIEDSTLSKFKDDSGATQLTGKAEDEAATAKKQMSDLDSNVNAILNLLEAVTTGNALRVKVEDYGLTGGFGV